MVVTGVQPNRPVFRPLLSQLQPVYGIQPYADPYPGGDRPLNRMVPVAFLSEPGSGLLLPLFVNVANFVRFNTFPGENRAYSTLFRP